MDSVPSAMLRTSFQRNGTAIDKVQIKRRRDKVKVAAALFIMRY